ncbi:hypothetical protein CBL_03753 [Carabus blaptoides fortunei]
MVRRLSVNFCGTVCFPIPRGGRNGGCVRWIKRGAGLTRGLLEKKACASSFLSPNRGRLNEEDSANKRVRRTKNSARGIYADARPEESSSEKRAPKPVPCALQALQPIAEWEEEENDISVMVRALSRQMPH